MCWSRTGSAFDLLLWLALCALWWIGGWLICVHVFRLRWREAFFAGGACGFLLFILAANAAAYALPLEGAYWAGAGAVFFGGLAAAYRSKIRPVLPLRAALALSPLIVFLVTLAFFALVNRGLAIWDDYASLPIVSRLAAGDFPPSFHLDPARPLDYHYGLHLFAASLVRIGGFYPWSAFDSAKTLSLAFALALAWLWLRRFTKDRLALSLGLALILFAAGSRWLLLFAPQGWLKAISAEIQLLGSAYQTAPDLYRALPLPWNIEGGGPFPFPFAFANGELMPLSLSLGGPGAMPAMTLFLLMLLAQRAWQPAAGLVFGLLLLSLALTAEHLFLMLWGGALMAILAGWIIQRDAMRRQQVLSWSWALLPGLLLAPLIGGAITQLAHRWLAGLSGEAVPGAGILLPELGLRWPPAFLSDQLGRLALGDPGQVLIAFIEMGPLLLLAPLGCWITWRALQRGKWFKASLGIAAALGFLAPLVIRFSQRERDLSRLAGAALFIWLVMCLPYIWLAARRGKPPLRVALAVGYVVAVVSGLALLPAQMSAIASVQPSYFVQEPDAWMAAEFWDRLQPGARVLDLGYIHRAPALFGRSAGRAYENYYVRLPEFEALMARPDTARFADAGYGYLYLDKRAWNKLTAAQREAFQQPCVQLLKEQRTALNDFRRLLDVRACQSAEPTAIE